MHFIVIDEVTDISDAQWRYLLSRSALMPTRDQVYAAIDSERAYQIAQRGNAKRHEGQPPMTPGEYILCMEKCLADARVAWYAPNGGAACLDHVRKVAALGTACMELHGAPPRAAAPAGEWCDLCRAARPVNHIHD